MLVRSMMTRLSLLVVGLLAVVSANAQNTYDRLSVIEEFTSATCPPCVAVSESLKDVVDLSNGVVSVRFHMYWPAPNDPWNLDNPTDNDTRRGYYSVQGIPNAWLNGTSLNTGSAQSMISAVQAANAAKSPIKVEVTETPNASGGDVAVKITTNIALGPQYKLHVAVVSYHTEMPNLPNELANSNGEDEFYDAMNKMLPNASGTALNMTASSNQTFNFSYARKNAETWPSGQQYIVAYVQNNTTKEVLNAGTNLKVSTAKISVSGKPYEWIPQSSTKDRTITVTNSGDEELLVTVVIKNEASLNAAQWTAVLSANELTLPANGSSTVKVTTTSVARANFAPIEIEVTPVTVSGISKPSSLVYGYLTEGSKIIVWSGSTANGATGNILTALATTHANSVAYMPYSQDVINSFSPSEFDAGVFPVGHDGGAYNIIAFVPAVQAMLAAGKSAWLSAPVGMAASFDSRYQQYAEFQNANAFFSQTLGLSIKDNKIKARNDGSVYTSFPIAGVSGDPIGDDYSATANQPTQNWRIGLLEQELISIGSGSKAKSWLFADNTSANISGIRWQDPNTNGKVVYSTIGAEHISNTTARNEMMQRVLDWLLEATNVPAPEITLSKKIVNFGNIQVGESANQSFVILNSGNADLVIESIELNGSDAVDFDIIAGQPTTGPITVAPNGSHNVTVQFSPSEVKSSYNASIVITANAVADDVTLRGGGVSSVETEVASETGAISLSLVGTNPINEASSVEVRANGTMNITLVDASGRTVATVFNGAIEGQKVVPVSAAGLSSGTYLMVASNGSESAVLSLVVAK